MASARAFVTELLKKADVEIGGTRPQDIVVHDERLFNRVIRYGTLGLGEAYMDGWWEASALDVFIYKVLISHVDKEVKINFASVSAIVKAFFFNQQSRSGATKVAKEHYDLSVELYMSFLDPYNQYTCGYFKNTENLAVAQEQKLDLICKKLQLKKGERVLDIGCGWGGFAKYAAERYGVRVTGITLSKEQLAYATEFTKGLDVELRLQDYREVNEPFDKILSCGMIEHVGPKNYREKMEMVNRCLEDDGLFLLHTIGYKTSKLTGDPWINKYIFPGGVLPSLAQIGKATEGLFIVEDLHNFGADYDTTLMAWFKNFDAAWPKLKGKYDERFYRMWKYYLLTCAGVFRAREAQLWQIVLSKDGVPGGYKSVR
jgi:cyclopropane-fatty-acyl-phospholipid synthase